MNVATTDLSSQAQVLGNYLVHQPLDPQLTKRYEIATPRLSDLDSLQTDKVFLYALKHPRLLRILDAGSALIQPNNALRRQLYILLAIVEATPDYAALFLPRSTGPWQIVVVGLRGITAVAFAAIGIVAVKVIGHAR